MALLLSQRSEKGQGIGRDREVVKRWSQIALCIAWAVDMYSASVEDNATVFCFTADQETRDPQRKNAYPDILWWFVSSEAQSASMNA